CRQRLASSRHHFLSHVRIRLQRAIERGEGRTIDLLAIGPLTRVAFLKGASYRFLDRVQGRSAAKNSCLHAWLAFQRRSINRAEPIVGHNSGLTVRRPADHSTVALALRSAKK